MCNHGDRVRVSREPKTKQTTKKKNKSSGNARQTMSLLQNLIANVLQATGSNGKTPALMACDGAEQYARNNQVRHSQDLRDKSLLSPGETHSSTQQHSSHGRSGSRSSDNPTCR